MAGSTVLHINDDPEIIALVRPTLSRAGYKVVEAYTGYDGLELAEEHSPDLILLELNLSDISGWKVFQSLRANPDTAIIPVIMLSVRTQSMDKLLEMQTSGVDEHLVKPFTPDQLLETARRVIEGR